MSEMFDAKVSVIFGHPAQGTRVVYTTTVPMVAPTQEQANRIFALALQSYAREHDIPKDTLENTSLDISWDNVADNMDDAKGGRGALYPEWMKIAQTVFGVLKDKRTLAKIKEEYPTMDMLPENVRVVVERFTPAEEA